jgi:hypothetical protein
MMEAKMRMIRRTIVAAAICGVLVTSGCQVSSDKHGDNENVKIATPFGGMEVKTNDATALENLGMPTYPGAVLVKKDKDSGSADVNLSFGKFQLRVKALSYRTADSSDKVSAFYRNALARYGDVLQCVNGRPVGTPTQTSGGLTCDKDKDNHIMVDEDMSGKMELKAGSKQHQHLVAINPEGSATKFALIALDLPGHITVGDDEKNQ